MTAINPVASAAAGATTPTSSTSTPDLSSTLNLSFSTYLKILTTQLQNQDPTNATDPNQFTQELIQMGGVQQQITTNQDLTQLVNAQNSSTLATGVGYIGNYIGVSTPNDNFALQNGSSEFGFDLDSAASNATVTIQDANGNTVATFSGAGNKGTNYLSWNGMDNTGTQLPDGAYTFQIAATTAAGVVVAVSNPVAMAKVTGVQTNTDGTVQLMCGSVSTSSANVSAIYTPTSLPAAAALSTTATPQTPPSS